MRDRAWWSRLTAQERSELVALERSTHYYGRSAMLPEDCGECGNCSTPSLGGGLCPLCNRRLLALIGKAGAEQEKEDDASKPLDVSPPPAVHSDEVGLGGLNDLDAMFPHPGRFEDNIYRPSAKEFIDAMPDWTPTVSKGQLVMEMGLTDQATAVVWTSVKVGQIAGGTGDDSIRVTRRDEAKDRTFYFKNEQDWVTRRVPKECDTPKQAVAHLVQKIEAQVGQFSATCPECGAVHVKCKAGRGRDVRYWWKLGCRHESQLERF